MKKDEEIMEEVLWKLGKYVVCMQDPGVPQFLMSTNGYLLKILMIHCYTHDNTLSKDDANEVSKPEEFSRLQSS